MTALRRAAQRLAVCPAIEAIAWRVQVRHYLPLIERLISQTERRVLAGEAVPAGEKLVSLFETHADIIVKGGRDVPQLIPMEPPGDADPPPAHSLLKEASRNLALTMTA